MSMPSEGADPGAVGPQDEGDDFSAKLALSGQSEELEPRSHPLGISARFVQNEQVSLTMTRKLPSATFEDFTVTDANDVVLFRCRGHARSLHQKMSEFATTNF